MAIMCHVMHVKEAYGCSLQLDLLTPLIIHFALSFQGFLLHTNAAAKNYINISNIQLCDQHSMMIDSDDHDGVRYGCRNASHPQ